MTRSLFKADLGKEWKIFILLPPKRNIIMGGGEQRE